MSEIYETQRLENQLCFPLYACSREVVKKYRPYLDELNLTYTQYIVMMVMWEKKTINVKELGAKLYLDSGTLTPVLKSLESKGYVYRHRSLKDERVLLVDVTEEGQRLRDKAVSVPEKVSKFLGLTSEEAVTLYRLLYKLLDSDEDSAE